jgi:PAS domain S-box-containing protein
MAKKEDGNKLIIRLKDAEESRRAAHALEAAVPGMRISVVEDEGEVTASLSSRGPDFLLMDLHTFERTRGKALSVVPLAILVYDSKDLAQAQEEMQRGAFDLFERDGSQADLGRLATYFRVLVSLRARFQGAFSVLEGRYENLVRALPDIIYELDMEGRFSFVNDAVRLLGYEPAELIGKHFSTLLHESDAQAVDRDAVLGMYEGVTTGSNLSPKLFNERRGLDRKTENLEVRIRRKSGDGAEMIATVISYGEVSAVGEYGQRAGQKEFIGSVGIIRDVTLRRKSEETLRKLYQAVDQLSASVCVADRSFELEYVNPAFFQTTGFSPPDAIGHDLFGFLRYTPERAREIRSLVLDGFDVRDETTVRKADEGGFWASVLISPVRSPEGIITHAVAILEDISSRRAMEELLRTAKEEAEETARGKGEFLVNLGHELKGPVSAILSEAQLIRMAPEDAAPHAAHIIKSARSLLETLNGIMDLMHSESREDEPVLRSFPLGSFVRRICEPYREHAAFRGLSFEILPEGDGIIESDPDRLGRAIGILTDNAVNYTEVGGVTVDYSIERQEGNVPHLSLTVGDTGSGLVPQDLSRIFDPFNDVSASFRKKAHGTGVGLALARNLIRSLGGEIRVESDPGHGSRFSILLPVGSPAGSDASGPLPALPHSLLLVDDNEVNLEYMRVLLEAAGHEARTATGGREALHILETHLVDAVFLDVQMPVMTGLELARRIRGASGTRYPADLPIIALTAFDPSELEDPDVRFDGVFGKPADIPRLLAAVDAALAKYDAASPVLFSEQNPGEAEQRESILAGAESKGRAALDTLTSTLESGFDAEDPNRADARAAAGRLVAAFETLAASGAATAARQLETFFPSEDASSLAVRLARLGRAFDLALTRFRG